MLAIELTLRIDVPSITVNPTVICCPTDIFTQQRCEDPWDRTELQHDEYGGATAHLMIILVLPATILTLIQSPMLTEPALEVSRTVVSDTRPRTTFPFDSVGFRSVRKVCQGSILLGGSGHVDTAGCCDDTDELVHLARRRTERIGILNRRDGECLADT